MFLRNFYEESDRNNRRRWKIIGLVFFAVFAYIAFIIVVSSNQPTQEDIEQSISKSPVLTELDRYCQDIPKPPNFKYIFKQIGGNSFSASISYWYRSGSSFAEVRDFYIPYLEKEGWTREDLWDEDRSALPKLLKYRKGNRTFNLERITTGKEDYALDCSIDR